MVSLENIRHYLLLYHLIILLCLCTDNHLHNHLHEFRTRVIVLKHLLHEHILRLGIMLHKPVAHLIAKHPPHKRTLTNIHILARHIHIAKRLVFLHAIPEHTTKHYGRDNNLSISRFHFCRNQISRP